MQNTKGIGLKIVHVAVEQLPEGSLSFVFRAQNCKKKFPQDTDNNVQNEQNQKLLFIVFPADEVRCSF